LKNNFCNSNYHLGFNFIGLGWCIAVLALVNSF